MFGVDKVTLWMLEVSVHRIPHALFTGAFGGG